MGELQKLDDIIAEQPYSTRGIVPEALLALALLSPDREQAVSTYLERVQDRQRRRAAEFEEEVLDITGLSPEELLARLLDDEAASELFGQAVVKAIETAEEVKRHALARAVASGLLKEDQAAIDIAKLHARAIAMLEIAHIRALLEIRESERGSYSQDKLRSWAGGALDLLLSELEQKNLIKRNRREKNLWEVTPFGNSLIQFLEEDPQKERRDFPVDPTPT